MCTAYTRRPRVARKSDPPYIRYTVPIALEYIRMYNILTITVGFITLLFIYMPPSTARDASLFLCLRLSPTLGLLARPHGRGALAIAHHAQRGCEVDDELGRVELRRDP